MFSLKDIEFSPKDRRPNKSLFQLLSNIETACRSIESDSSQIEKGKKGILHIEVEKYLNSVYPFYSIQTQPFSIVLTSKASDGFGDVIWGVRALQALQPLLPNAHFSIISDALDKFQLFIPPSSNISLIYADFMAAYRPREFSDKARGRATLENCDLVINGPYLWHTAALSSVFEIDIKTLVAENRYIEGLEYDCARYFPSWADQILTNTFLSGIGDNAYGIFIIDELKQFSRRDTPLSSAERVHYIQELESTRLKKTLTRIEPDGNCPIYWGYGELLPTKFLEVVSRIEDKSTSTQDVIILLKSRDPGAIDEFVNALQKKPLINVSSITQVKDEYPISDEELEASDARAKDSRRYDPSWISAAKQAQTELRAKIPAGEDCLTLIQELINFSQPGKKIMIVTPDGLTQTDMMAIYKFTEPVTMVTGDQSLSEGISANKHILYDPRKADTLNWLIEIARRNELVLVSDLLKLCAFEDNVVRMVEILSDPEYARQNKVLSVLCQQRDLSPALQHMVCRRLVTSQHRDLQVLENEMHVQIESIFSSKTSESLKHQLIQQLLESNQDLLNKIEHCAPLVIAKSQDQQSLLESKQGLG